MNPDTRKWGGWRLKAYHWEHELYPQFRTIKLEKCRAPFYIKKLARHFKVSQPFLSVKRKNGGGYYRPTGYGTGIITLCNHPSLGLICHEFAHHLQTIRYPGEKRWHGKKFKHELKRVYTFAKRYLPKEKAAN